MSWLEKDWVGQTGLKWWKERFLTAKDELLNEVDECIEQDIKLHSLTWMLQEVEIANLTVSMLSEDQDWYRDYVEEHAKKRKEKNPLDDDYWSEDEEQEEEDGVEDGEAKHTQSFASQRWEEMFSDMGNALQQVRALSSDVVEWIHVGGRRRMGKQVWHCWRVFSRCRKLHQHSRRIRLIAGLDIYQRLMKEPNFGVKRKIISPAARDFWYRQVVPKVLASVTVMEKRSVPCVHPSRIEEVLACKDAVTQAPIQLVAEEIIRYFKLSREEMLVLPYLLGSGCCDYHHGGKFTFGADPCCHAEAIGDLRDKLRAFEESGSGMERRKGDKDADGERAWRQFVDEVEHRRRMLDDAVEATQEFIDCRQLQVIIDYWCPEDDKKRFSDAKEILPHMYVETGRNASLLLKLSFELNLRARNLFPIRAKHEGSTSMSPAGKFRSLVLVLIGAVRLWRSTPKGLQAWMKKRFAESEDASETLNRSQVMVEEKLELAISREKLEDVALLQAELSNVRARMKEEESLRDRLRDRMYELSSADLGPKPHHPLKVAIKAAAKSLVQEVKSYMRDGQEKQLKIADWFYFDQSMDSVRLLVQEAPPGTFLLRYSKEPGILVANWSMGVGQQMKSARIYRLQHQVSSSEHEALHDRKGSRGQSRYLMTGTGGISQGIDRQSSSRIPLGRKGSLPTAVLSSQIRKEDALDRGRTPKSAMSTAKSIATPLQTRSSTILESHVKKSLITRDCFAWSKDATLLESYENLGKMVSAVVSTFRYPAKNTVPQLGKHSGYL